MTHYKIISLIGHRRPYLAGVSFEGKYLDVFQPNVIYPRIC